MGKVKVEVGGIRPKKVLGETRRVYKSLEGLGSQCFREQEDYENFQKEMSRFERRYGNGELVSNTRRMNSRRLIRDMRASRGDAIHDLKHMCEVAVNLVLPENIPREVQAYLRYNG
jgi:hypothetical protein